MAILLIKASDGPNPLSYKKGDVVEVREDDAQFGRCECLPTFLVIKVDGMKADLAYLTNPVKEPQLVFDYRTMEHSIVNELASKRKYKFDIDANVSKERLAEISASEKMVIDTHAVSTITDKTMIEAAEK